MKKITASFVGMLLFLAACKKQEASISQDEEQDQITQVSKRGCASYEVLQEQIAADPSLRVRMEQVEDYTARVLSNPSAYRLVGDSIEIPVIVHVIYRTATENISDAQIKSQITVLNEDYQNQNADKSKLPANSFQTVVSTGLKVRFVLAQTNRVLTKTKSWTTNDAVKSTKKGGADPITPTKNLNIWVCNLGQGLLGYAQFPGGSASTDGVVILYSAFGSKAKYVSGVYSTPFDLGRTATHEVGHWMNLRHIWGDDSGACSGSDLVTDTPNQGSENYGTPAYPHLSCSNGPKGDMFMNYMDYTDDKGMYMFSAGQNSRMMAIFAAAGPRAGFGVK